MGFALGRKPEHETVRFLFKVASAGDVRYLVCAVGAAALVSSSDRFSLGVLEPVVVHVCVLLGACCICGT